MQELSNLVWGTARFHALARSVENNWMAKSLGSDATLGVDIRDAIRLAEAAAILACSESPDHRKAAFRVATVVYDTFGSEVAPLDQALRVVLTRLGNFPSLSTRSDVANAQDKLPVSLVAEELARADARTIVAEGGSLVLTDLQYKIWSELNNNRAVAISAPTSAGKSYVLQHYLRAKMEAMDSGAIVYIVPTRALIAQVAGDLVAEGRDKVPIVTVPLDLNAKIPPRAIFVMTQERLQILMSSHPELSADMIVIDEAQSITDGSRGVLLQWVVDDLLERSPKAQILFAGPSVRNLEIFGQIFDVGTLAPVQSDDQTVAQNFLVVKVEAATSGEVSIHLMQDDNGSRELVARRVLQRTLASRIDRLVRISHEFGLGSSNIVYANGAAEAETIALQLADLLADREPNEKLIALAALAKESVHQSYALASCIVRGVAFHYANIPTQLRKEIEAAVSSGDIDFLVCTSTLLQGVNLPTKNIFVLAPEKGRNRPMASVDFWNLAGRAGRLKREFHGNIFLIDYDTWKSKPLSGERANNVVPAIRENVTERLSDLVRVISGERPESRADENDLETSFQRLYSEHQRGRLQEALRKASPDRDVGSQVIAEALTRVSQAVKVPAEVLKITPTISAHKQQRMYDLILKEVSKGEEAARAMLPKHPREDAFDSYAMILELCHRIILEIDTAKGLYRFHALLALRWMRGIALPQIIQAQIDRKPSEPIRKTIRTTLDLIEKDIRFQTVRLFGCYISLMTHALEQGGMGHVTRSIPSIPVYLEVGASDRTMISFISLGLSRVVAMKLNEESVNKDMDVEQARKWLIAANLEVFGLSPLLLEEVRALIQKA